jgi:hypothetical protein
MRNRHLFICALLILLTGTIVAPAKAITSGEPDNGQHPYVGLAVFFLNGVPQWRCSGTLLTPTVFLTAGHCTFDPAVPVNSARVYFEEKVSQVAGYPNAGGVTGIPHRHPQFNGSLTLPNTHDVGVVVLDSPVTDKGFGRLPPQGYLNGLETQRGQNELGFTVVGYGLQEVRPHFSSIRDRYKATSRLVNLRSALTDGFNIHTSSNPGQGSKNGQNSGGTCFGDSGGPVFHGGYDSNLVVGITSFGLNQNCKGADFAYRTDIPDTRNFLAQFGVALP